MCGPAAIPMIQLAVTVAAAAAAANAQNESKKATERTNKQRAEAATQANNADNAALRVEQNQQAEGTAEQIAANNTAGAQAAATNRVAGGEAGVSGRSVDSLLRNLAGLNSADNANATTQYLRSDATFQARRTNSLNNANSTINTLQTPQNADYLGAGLRIAGAAVDYNKATTKK
jgi:hypothetical protein